MLFTLQRYEFFSKSQPDVYKNWVTPRCCLPCKGTNFLANHNRVSNSKHYIKMLFTLQRYEFFSKSQHLRNEQPWKDWCCLPCKGTNFLANHNTFCYSVTCYSMLFTLQRYEFFSKSQQRLKEIRHGKRCCLPCKGTNFLANHNISLCVCCLASDVVYLAKVRIF